MKLLPRDERRGADGTSVALVAQFDKQGPQPAHGAGQWRWVEFRDGNATAAFLGLEVLAQGAAIGLPGVKVLLGLGEGGKGLAQALIKSSRRRTAAVS